MNLRTSVLISIVRTIAVLLALSLLGMQAQTQHSQKNDSGNANAPSGSLAERLENFHTKMRAIDAPEHWRARQKYDSHLPNLIDSDAVIVDKALLQCNGLTGVVSFQRLYPFDQLRVVDCVRSTLENEASNATARIAAYEAIIDNLERVHIAQREFLFEFGEEGSSVSRLRFKREDVGRVQTEYAVLWEQPSYSKRFDLSRFEKSELQWIKQYNTLLGLEADYRYSMKKDIEYSLGRHVRASGGIKVLRGIARGFDYEMWPGHVRLTELSFDELANVKITAVIANRNVETLSINPHHSDQTSTELNPKIDCDSFCRAFRNSDPAIFPMTTVDANTITDREVELPMTSPVYWDVRINDIAFVSYDIRSPTGASITVNPDICELIGPLACDFFLVHEHCHVHLKHQFQRTIHKMAFERDADRCAAHFAKPEAIYAAWKLFRNGGSSTDWHTYGSPQERAKRLCLFAAASENWAASHGC